MRPRTSAMCTGTSLLNDTASKASVGVSGQIALAIILASFDGFWRAQTPAYAPTIKAVAQMSEAVRARLIEVVCAELPNLVDRRIAYRARASEGALLADISLTQAYHAHD